MFKKVFENSLFGLFGNDSYYFYCFLFYLTCVITVYYFTLLNIIYSYQDDLFSLWVSRVTLSITFILLLMLHVMKMSASFTCARLQLKTVNPELTEPGLQMFDSV